MKHTKEQLYAKCHLSKWKVGALFMEAGTGKTRVAIDLVNSVYSDLVIYIAPLRTITHTPSIIDEVNKWGGFNSKVVYYGIESIGMSDRVYLEVLSLFNIYERVFIVLDESLKIKNTDAKRTKRLLHISEKAEYKLILNGTPLSRNILDLHSQMEFLSPNILNMTHSEFYNIFCRYKKITKRKGNKQIVKEFITGHENIDYLYSLIRPYVYECDLELNIKQSNKDILFNLTEESKESYKWIKDLILNDDYLDFRDNNVFLELTQKMQSSYCVDENKINKLKELFNTIDESNSIIFCKFVESQNVCKELFRNATVLSYQKEALGLNLQHLNNTVFFDKIFDYALRIQASRRTYRTGQELDCNYFDLTSDCKLDAMIDKNIYNKTNMLDYFKSISKEQLISEL